MVEVDKRCGDCAVTRAAEDEGCTTLIVEIVETERAESI